MTDDSDLISKGPCPACGSSDANALYSDGHTYCFSCKTYGHGYGEEAKPQRKPMSADLLPLGEPTALPKRGLTLETCTKWGYTVSKMGGKTVQLANHRDPMSGEVVAQHVRTAGKDFPIIGDKSKMGLWGRHIWRDTGKRVIITEGEIDAMSISQVLGHKWQVVSLPYGCDSARKAITAELDWLLKFDAVILAFDMDDPGHKAVEDCAGLFPAGKLFVMTLPLKDANDMLVAGRTEELIQAIWGPKAYRPDGIVTVAEVRQQVMEDPTKDLTWCFRNLDEATFGRRYGELVCIGAGTGVGKTTFITQMINHDLSCGHPVAIFAFEATPAELVKRVAGTRVGRQFHIPGDWTMEDLDAAVTVIEQGPALYLYDHFGACDWDIVRDRIRFLRHTHGVRVFYVDHLTALAAAAGDERTALERIMSEVGSLVKELGVWIMFVSHLATPEGTPHEEGGRVKIRHFKGSRSIGFWCHLMIGLERDQQSEDREAVTTYRVLKDRYTGRATGMTFPIAFDQTTGRLVLAASQDGFGDETGGNF